MPRPPPRIGVTAPGPPPPPLRQRPHNHPPPRTSRTLGQQVVRQEHASPMAGITISVHDLQGRRIAEYAKDPVLGTVTLLRSSVSMDGWAPFKGVEGGQVYFLAWNTVGRPKVAFDETGTVVWRARYTPFGGIEAVTVNTALTSQDLRFPGQWFQLGEAA